MRSESSSERSRPRRTTAPVPAFTAAIVAGDAGAAAAISAAYLAAAGSRVAVVSDLFHPAQYEVGELWYQGRLGVAEEHRATAIVMSLAGRLPLTPTAGPVRAGARCLLAGVARERHAAGMQLLSMALEDDGWIVDQLQPPTTRAEVLRASAEWRPDVVGLSAAYVSTTAELATTVDALHDLGLPVMVGGPLFNRAPGLWQSIGADAHGADARVATVLMRRLLRAS